MTWRAYLLRTVGNCFLTVVATIVILNVLRPSAEGEPSPLLFALFLGLQMFVALMLRDIAYGVNRSG